MIADIQLFNVPDHQLANRQFIVGNLGNPIKTVPDVKVGNGPILDIALPWDDAFANANIVKIGNRCYDIVGIDDVTYSEKTIRMRLMYNAVTSLLRKNINGKIILKGWWDRTPIPLSYAKDIQAVNSTFIENKRFNFPVIGKQTYWVQITARADISEPSLDVSKLTIYGCPVKYSDTILSRKIPGSIEGPNDSLFPSLTDIINDLDTITGIPSSTIIDVAVSPRCPWEYTYVGDVFSLIDTSNEVIEPIAVNNGKSIYKISGSNAQRSDYYESPINLKLTDFELYNGRISIVDDGGNPIYAVPKEYFWKVGNDNIFWFGSRAISDITGVNTRVIMDTVVNASPVIIPGGHLPWIGDSWAEYQALTLAYDRENLARAVDNVYKQRDIDMINSVSSSMLTVAVGGAINPVGTVAGLAQMGMGLATSAIQADMAATELYAQQNAKEGLIKNTPSSYYQAGYGLDYLHYIHNSGPAHVRLDLPEKLTEEDFNNYIKYRGYPCGMYRSVELPSDGYIKGNIYNDFSAFGNAVETDMLRKEIASGCRIVIS